MKEDEFCKADELDYEYAEVFGCNLVQRDGNWDGKDKHVMVKVYGGDDGNYWPEMEFSSFWLDGLITMLQEAQNDLKENKNKFKKDGKWGHKFK